MHVETYRLHSRADSLTLVHVLILKGFAADLDDIKGRMKLQRVAGFVIDSVLSKIRAGVSHMSGRPRQQSSRPPKR